MFGVGSTSKTNTTPAQGFFGAASHTKKHFMVDFVKEVSEDIYAWCFYLGVKPHWQQRELLDAYMSRKKDRRIAVRSGQGPGKCLHGEAEVLTADGPTKIQDLNGRENIVVWGMDENTEKITVANARCFPSGYKYCVEVEADAGQALKLSTDHPVYTQRGWVRAEDLRNKDLMAMPRELEWVGTEGVSSEEARWVGYILGDGGTTGKGGVQFTQLPGDILQDFLRCTSSLGMTYRYNQSRSKAKEVAVRQTGSKEVMGRWRGKTLAKHKRLPSRFWKAEKSKASEILATLWLCDGYFEKDGTGICLASEKFIDDIQTALLFWGVHSRKKYKKSKCNGKYFDAWLLNITDRRSLRLFYKDILRDFHSFQKVSEGHEKYLKNIWIRPENTNTDVVPYDNERMKEVAETLNTTPANLRRGGWRGRANAWLSRKKFSNMVETTGYEGEYAKWASNDIFWVKVANVTPIEKSVPVYDLEVPGVGNFVARNLIVHNTWASALIGTHWSFCTPNSRLILTAPTMAQCKSAWLAQARDLVRNNDDADPRIRQVFKFLGTAYSLYGQNPNDWGCVLRTATNAESAQGQHRENMAVICEEASGISRSLITQYKGTLSNAEGKSMFMLIGNPNSRDCDFFDCFHSQAHKYLTLHWNSEETPETAHFSRKRNKDLAEEFGADSDVYRVRVLGEFPHTDPSVLINEDDLLACTKPEAKEAALAVNVKMRPVRKQIGIDLARYGGDKNTIAPFSGNIMLKLEAYSRTDPNATIDRAVMLQEHLGWNNQECTFVVDTSGMGEMAAGMLGSQRRMGRKMHEFYSQNTAHDSMKYDNKITEAWCLFAKEVRAHRIYLQYNKKLFQQLTSRLYSVTKNGKIKIETKDEYKKRNADSSDGELGTSPDEADGTVMGYYPHATASTRVVMA